MSPGHAHAADSMTCCPRCEGSRAGREDRSQERVSGRVRVRQASKKHSVPTISRAAVAALSTRPPATPPPHMPREQTLTTAPRNGALRGRQSARRPAAAPDPVRAQRPLEGPRHLSRWQHMWFAACSVASKLTPSAVTRILRVTASPAGMSLYHAASRVGSALKGHMGGLLSFAKKHGYPVKLFVVLIGTAVIAMYAMQLRGMLPMQNTTLSMKQAYPVSVVNGPAADATQTLENAITTVFEQANRTGATETLKNVATAAVEQANRTGATETLTNVTTAAFQPANRTDANDTVTNATTNRIAQAPNQTNATYLGGTPWTVDRHNLMAMASVIVPLLGRRAHAILTGL